MARYNQIPYCCGINELGYIASDERAADSVMSIPRTWRRAAHIIFSVTSRHTADHLKGKQLTAFIKKHKLGTVLEAPARVNTGHSGTLKAWLWTPSKTAVYNLQSELVRKNPTRYGYQGTFAQSCFRNDATKRA